MKYQKVILTKIQKYHIILLLKKDISLDKEIKKEISTKDKLKLEKLENKVQKAQHKLEKAEQKLPKKTKIKFEKSFDEKTNTSKTKFHIEKEVKPQYQVKPIRSAVKKAVVTPHSLYGTRDIKK